MENKKEGYTEVVIPRTEFKSCRGCKYFDFQFNWFEEEVVETCTVFGQLNTKHLKEQIYGHIVTPDWCPFLNK